METLRHVKAESPECAALVKILTANFECCSEASTFPESKVSAGGSHSSRCKTDEADIFYGYSSKGKQVLFVIKFKIALFISL